MKNKVTINDIAELAGVSKATISFYLNGHFEKMSEKTKKKIKQVIEKTGYNPSLVARSLSSKKTKIIGVIIGDITNSFANQLVKGIMDYAKEEDYQVILASSNYEFEQEKKHVRNMLAMGVDGFIVQPTVHFEDWFIHEKWSTPILYFDSPSQNTQGLWVKTNNYEAVYETCEHLVQKGYDHYIIATADPNVLATRLERNKGFIDCLELNSQSYEVFMMDEKSTPAMIEKKMKKELKDKNRRVCIFACNNWLLGTVVEGLKPYYDSIPKQLGVVGFDSLEWSEIISPSITTIVQPAYEEGMKAIAILIDKLQNRGIEPPQQILKCKVNWCDSTEDKK